MAPSIEEYTFHNVTITVPAATAKDAYNKLCSALDTLEGEYETNTYTSRTTWDDPKSTDELWPTE